MRGQGDFSAALIAAGRDSDQIKKSVNGSMSFSFKNEVIIEFNLRKAGSFKVSDKEKTDFSEISGNPVAEKGMVRLDDLSAQIHGIRVTGNG